MYVTDRAQPQASPTVAEANKHLVFNAVRTAGMARVEDLVRATGRSQPTVLKWLAKLEDEGWVDRPGVGASTGGRPPSLYRFAADAGYVLGIALEIPGARLTLVNMRGAATASEGFCVEPSEGPEALLAEVERRTEAFVAAHLPAGKRLLQAGAVLSGFIDRSGGVSLATPRIPGWQEVPFRGVLARRLGVPVVLHHHVDALTTSEVCFGSTHDADDVLYFDVGYGLGVRHVKNGQGILGSFGNAGLIGHTTIVPDGRPACCGNRGCLEEYVSGRALLRDAAANGRTEGTAGFTADEDDVWTTAEASFRAAEAGDATARRRIDDLAHFLGLGIANAVNIFDVPRVVLSGFVRAGGTAFRQRLSSAVRARLQPVLARHLDLRFAEAPRSAGRCARRRPVRAARATPVRRPPRTAPRPRGGGERASLTPSLDARPADGPRRTLFPGIGPERCADASRS
ncbi:MAG: ROK family protein [Trueperaceae bacterium]|nr:ROK family protein [Trueperaceae bacterium]